MTLVYLKIGLLSEGRIALCDIKLYEDKIALCDIKLYEDRIALCDIKLSEDRIALCDIELSEGKTFASFRYLKTRFYVTLSRLIDFLCHLESRNA